MTRTGLSPHGRRRDRTGREWLLASALVGRAPGFPAMKARRLRSLLQRELGYVVDPDSERGGSHTWLISEGRPRVRLAFHDGDEIGGDVVRKVLVRMSDSALMRLGRWFVVADAQTNVIITHDEEYGPYLESPQVPGFTFGRPTETEFQRDYRKALQDAGVTGVVVGHHQSRHVTREDVEYVVRFAEAGDRDARREVVNRLGQILATDDRHQLLRTPTVATGEVVFVVVLPEDTLGDLMDQMYGERDAMVMVMGVADSGIFTSSFASSEEQHPGWQSAADRGWDRDTTVAQMAREFAAGTPATAGRVQSLGQLVLA